MIRSVAIRCLRSSTSTLVRATPCAADMTMRSFSTAASTKPKAAAPAAAPAAKKAAAPAPAAPASLTGGMRLDALAKENPHLDVVRYEHKNRAWTMRHVQYYSEALAIGFVEMGFQPGDVILSWLPDHFQDQMVLQFAASKSGLILYRLDPSLATKDPAKAKQALAAALTVTKANILISQEAGSDVNYVQLAQDVIPELRIFDTATGEPFITPRFPHLRLAVHTGFDQDDKAGWFPLRHMVVPSDNIDALVDAKKLSASTPLAGELELDANQIPVKAKTLTNAQVVEKNLWPTYVQILNKKFHEVPGVGVIF